MYETIFLINFGSVICCIVNLAIDSSFRGPDNEIVEFQTTLTTVSAVAVASQACFTILFGLYAWWPIYNIYQALLLVGAVLQFITSTLILLVNSVDPSTGSPKLTSVMRVSYRYSPHLSCILTSSAFMGFGISLAAGKSYRLSEVITRFIRFYIILTSGCAILSFVYICISFDMIGPSKAQDSLLWNVASVNPGLSVASFLLCLIGIISAFNVQVRPGSILDVEVYDLSKLTESQFMAYSQLIDRYSKQVPGSPSGSNAISLMNAYRTADQVPGMECLVLRVFRPEPVNMPVALDAEAAVENNKPHTHLTYEQIPEWINLDREMILPFDSENDQMSEVTVVPSTPQQMSKNKLKRLQKKKIKGHKMDTVRQVTAAEAIDENSIKFQKELMSTEALVLITAFRNYDLTANVDGRLGKLLSRFLGSRAPFWKPLCINLGLVGFHWPFREATFYCSPSKRPVARSAAVLRAITQWNDRLPRKDQFTVLLNPVYQHEAAEQALIPSGWLPTPLPATHIIDLRPYKGKTVSEYLKAIKYRNQSGAFLQAGGQFIESIEFTDEECNTAFDLWKNIADKRTGEGKTSVLATPRQSLFKSFGRNQEVEAANGHRSLLFLKVGDDTIASCVLFRLGDTITSDLQGLDHELGRKYKAYFVMMQKVIDIALSEGIKFVDFGPTTAKPKIDIGSKSVPLMGGMYSNKFLLRRAISMTAKSVNQESEE
ncbi:hypothetical protein AWJ20_1396 [Sugiyamaella lignohabitans]|uniref:BioF2-like acetyltransferase domain-containing protein n=1 Tax=Sugiyamaella lignohabitans TaxID=796027 RepID=A0A167DNU0_9ASCO|nr:uncharacterized protein AWJ20_1396 [Sugiyamaella lignohabitans]ANB13115.1 hypothetical protein AWJ20_1396 [Sugiyamaella lignohabitans]